MADIDRMVEFARNTLPPIKPGIGPDGKEYYYLATGAEQGANVIRGEVAALPKPASVVADVREDGSWSVWVMGEDGSALLCCHPEFYCKVKGCTIQELAEGLGVKLS